MGYKTLELTLISASDLKNVNFIGKMDVYVVVSLSGDPRTKQKTPVHQDGGTSPYWNHTLRFTVDEATALNAGWEVVFQLKHEHTFGRDKDVGEVRVPVKELLNNRDARITTYQVRTPSGKFKGELKFSYKATDAIVQSKAAAAPVKAYPPTSSSASAYPYPAQSAYPAPSQTVYPPPPQSAYPQTAYPYPGQSAYPAPPATGYPYGGYMAPQQQPGYGYGYPQQKPKRNGGFGMGLGAGLLGGALGGLLIEDMVSDSYDGELTLISAKDLKSVSQIGKMDVYVAVSISGANTRTMKKTPVDRNGGSNPSWNHTLAFTFNKATAVNRNWSVVFKAMHRRPLWWDKVVGQVRVPVKDIFVAKKEAQTATCGVRRPSGELKGELEFSFKVSDAQPGYGYPQSRKADNGGFGIGLAAGLIGSVLLVPC
ncbi:hypothetical protein V2J09_023788 [Rumex salicifolius]